MSTWDDFLRDSIPRAEADAFLSSLSSPSLPPASLRYRAFHETPFEDIRVVILGQDPYHTPNVANGLAFSVSFGKPIPPSLVNILKEYQDDLRYRFPRSGDLSSWARNGVFLLNTALSVLPHEPSSHMALWSTFNSSVIRKIVEEKSNVVFILWGRHAQTYAPLINVRGSHGHFIIRSPHPSPFSARTGFFGSRPFSRTNSFLTSRNLEPVNWRLQ